MAIDEMPENTMDMQYEVSLENRITDAEFSQLQKYIHRNVGIYLSPQKRGLLIGRLQKLLREKRFENFDAYYHYLLADRSGNALNDLINRISTNFTFFWREPAHFDFMVQKVLPELTAQLRSNKEYDIRLWCAAAATGEEPYMLAILLREFLSQSANPSGWLAGVLATDVSQTALEQAKEGLYPVKSLEKLPQKYLQYFTVASGDGLWRVKDSIRHEVTFRRFNLMHPLPFKKKFHIIFCRNVMIYFDKATKASLVQRLYDGMVPGGYLFVGHSETLDRKRTPFSFVMPAVYRKPLMDDEGGER